MDSQNKVVDRIALIEEACRNNRTRPNTYIDDTRGKIAI